MFVGFPPIFPKHKALKRSFGERNAPEIGEKWKVIEGETSGECSPNRLQPPASLPLAGSEMQ
jgi:hypothetical protein